ncbi:class I glutamine amidotransferase-like protein [Chiua virens]|nr:class I glutamine amidotransferase-like protein [Chiua virens]
MTRLALLICDELIPPLKNIYGDYSTVFNDLLKSSIDHHTFTLDGYHVFKDMAYPPDNIHYDGPPHQRFPFVLVFFPPRRPHRTTGFSAYEDIEWINKLVAYVQHILASKPALKVFGICFGHQIIARALGGSCVPNNGRWEVAVTTIQLTPLGRAIFGTDQLDIQQMHRDHVPTVPPTAYLLGATDVTPNQGMVVFDHVPEDLASPHIPLTSIRVLTLQGHPEYTESFVSTLLDARVGILGETLVREARLRAGGIPGRHRPDGLACDGVGTIGKVIWGVLGIV